MPSVCCRTGLPLSLSYGSNFTQAMRVPFASFHSAYEGKTCHVVGRGPTRFDYNDLAGVTDPVFFINDAVCLEKYVRSETFFFAHDAAMRIWLDGSIRATAVLPANGKFLGRVRGDVLEHAGPLMFYRRAHRPNRDLLCMSRDEIANREELFVHSGTIHAALHFIWFCGFRRAIFIGCDGINHQPALAGASVSEDGYDVRLENRSKTLPWWQYGRIRKAQDLLTNLLCLEAVYLGTPDLPGDGGLPIAEAHDTTACQ